MHYQLSWSDAKLQNCIRAKLQVVCGCLVGMEEKRQIYIKQWMIMSMKMSMMMLALMVLILNIGCWLVVMVKALMASCQFAAKRYLFRRKRHIDMKQQIDINVFILHKR